jgi:hypothetical protein
MQKNDRQLWMMNSQLLSDRIDYKAISTNMKYSEAYGTGRYNNKQLMNPCLAEETFNIDCRFSRMQKERNKKMLEPDPRECIRCFYLCK